MKSGDGKMFYSVIVASTECPYKPDYMPDCMDSPCCYLCQHMVTCTCYDYQHGHLCKHCHRIYCLQNQQPVTIQEDNSASSEGMDSEPLDGETLDTELFDETDTNKIIGITPSKSVRDGAGMYTCYILAKCVIKINVGLWKHTYLLW